MSKNVNAIVTHQEKQAAGTSLLLRHCRSMGTAENRVPARIRLERRSAPSSPVGSSRA